MKSINLVLGFLALAAAAPSDAPSEVPRVPEGPNPDKVECHTDKKEAKSRAIYREYLQLLDFKGQPTLGPAIFDFTTNTSPTQHACARVRCEKNSAIVWCNDSEEELAFDNFDPIARGAGAVLKECKVKEERKRKISGKSHFDGWNIKVERADC